MSEQKQMPTAEQSLKYMAWDIKQMAKSIEKMTHCVEALAMKMCQYQPPVEEKKEYQPKLPF